MEENKDKLVFSSIRSEKVINNTSPKEAVDKAFHDEYIRQTQEIPVEQIKQAMLAQNGQTNVVSNQQAVQNSTTNVTGQVSPKVAIPQQVAQKTVVQQQPVQQANAQVVQQATISVQPQVAVQQPTTNEVPKQEVTTPAIPNQKIKPKPENKKVKAEKVVEEKHHMKKGVKKAFIILIVVFTALFSVFKIKSYFNNPRVITKNALVKVATEFNNIISLNDTATIIGDDYNISSVITTNLDSQVFKEDAVSDSKMLENLYLINNLNASKTTLSVIHNTEDKKFFYNRQTIKNDKVIIDDRYLIDNSTEYYYVKDFFNNYINDGNNTYFEALSEDVNAIDNINYLYKTIIDLLPSCIDEEYFNSTNTTTYLNNKTENVHKLSLKLDNIKMRKIANNLIKKLRKDKKAFNILNGVIDDFSNYRITSKTKFIGSNETINIIFYTKGTLNKTKKYEITKTGPKKAVGLTYEIDDKKITLLKDNKVKYYLKYTLNSSSIKVSISNKSNKKVGSFSFDNTDTRKHITYEIDEEDNITSVDINYKVTDVKKSSYKSSTKTIINIKKDNRNYLSGTINAESKVNNKVKINEEVKDVTFSSEVTDEKFNELENLFKTRLKKEVK